jgi:hypothetical protein
MPPAIVGGQISFHCQRSAIDVAVDLIVQSYLFVTQQLHKNQDFGFLCRQALSAFWLFETKLNQEAENLFSISARRL